MVVHPQLIHNQIQDSISNWANQVTIMILLSFGHVLISCLNAKHLNFIGVLRWTLFSNHHPAIVDLLLGDSCSVDEVEAVEINIPANIYILVNFVENLPSYIVVYMLLHFLVLFESDLFFNIFLEFAILVLFVRLKLQIFAQFFILFDNPQSMLPHGFVIVSALLGNSLEVLLLGKGFALFDHVRGQGSWNLFKMELFHLFL